MKELDKTNKYDLSKLTDEQLIELIKEVNKESKLYWFKAFKGTYLFYGKRSKTWLISDVKNKDIKYCATELFEDEKEYSVGQPYNKEKLLNSKTMTEDEKEIIKNSYLTYEEKENLLNNKPMTNEEKELWLFVYKESVKYQQSFVSHKEKADQAVKDFREALKM